MTTGCGLLPDDLPFIPPPSTDRVLALSCLAQFVVHDFNNLLGVITGNSALARRRMMGAGVPVDTIEQIELASAHALELTRLLSYYTGRVVVHAGPLDLDALAARALDRLACGSRPDLTLKPEVETFAQPPQGDTDLLTVALGGMVHNAVDACGARGGSVCLAIRRATCAAALVERYRVDPRTIPGDFLAFVVTDDGAGIDPAMSNRIFDPCFSSHIRGRGMGLAIAFGVARAHKGFITVQSAPGRGTRVSLFVPFVTG